MVLVLLTSCLPHIDWCSLVVCLYITEAGLMLVIVLGVILIILFLDACNVPCACVFLAGSNLACACLITLQQNLAPFMEHGTAQDVNKDDQVTVTI